VATWKKRVARDGPTGRSSKIAHCSKALAVLAQHSCTDPTVDVHYSYFPAGDFPALPARLEEGIYRIAQKPWLTPVSMPGRY